jgi:integrase
MALVAFYELRHRAAYWLYVEEGLPDRVVAEQMGHTKTAGSLSGTFTATGVMEL